MKKGNPIKPRVIIMIDHGSLAKTHGHLAMQPSSLSRFCGVEGCQLSPKSIPHMLHGPDLDLDTFEQDADHGSHPLLAVLGPKEMSNHAKLQKLAMQDLIEWALT